ncbi:MAG: Gfo/Idh/MocA family oxidoreductase [Bacteroidales bacterium]
MDNADNIKNTSRFSRRELLKSLATIPVVGAFAYGIYKKNKYDRFLNSNIANELGMNYNPVEFKPRPENGKLIRVGLVGYGIRGEQLMRGAGFAHPEWIDEVKKGAEENSSDTRYAQFLEQDDLNIEITGICDIFDIHAERAIEAASNKERKGTDSFSKKDIKRYKTYNELCAAPDVDAIIIAAPDHWHGPITIEAARNGKHVYCEKPMTWTVAETYAVREEVKKNNIVFQLGHQGRQTESYIKAKEAIDKKLLGKISLIEVTTNRNSPNGAWVYPIHEKASEKNIDWKQFIGPAPWHEFSLERFFRWRCWWDYSTGLSGDLLTHEYDAMNQILDLGIPKYATSSGGIYFYKDGRTVPDVLHTVFEFPDKDITMLYSATLASDRDRGKVIMGHDGNMQIGERLTVMADRESTRYEKKIKENIIDPSEPIYSYVPGKKNVDAVSSATEKYFAGRGLLYTYRNGKRMDTTHLHISEFIEAIRGNGSTSCNIEQGFEEAITAHMGTIAYKEGRRVEWDAVNEKII